MKHSILQIIKEEIQKFFSEWNEDEPNLADKYYKKFISTQKSTANIPKYNIDAELIGYVDKRWNEPLETPIPIYKNPKNLDGFTYNARGILMNNGDLYLGQSYNALHENILKLLIKKGIVSSTEEFTFSPSDNYIAVIRTMGTNDFSQSDDYRIFPKQFIEIFDIANKKHPYKFTISPINEETQSPLNPNWLISYQPQGYDAKILYEKR